MADINRCDQIDKERRNLLAKVAEGFAALLAWLCIPQLLNAGNVSFKSKTQSSETLFMTDTGKVGIGTTTPTSLLHINGSEAKKVIKVTATTTLDASANVVLCNAVSAFTLNLPQASSCPDRVYYLKNINSGRVTIDGYSSETIDGLATFPIGKNGALTIISDGTAWYSLGASVIESNTIGNNFWTMYSDGTMIQWCKEMTLPAQSISTGADSSTWTFSVPFVAPPSISLRPTYAIGSGNMMDIGSVQYNGIYGYPTATSFYFSSHAYRSSTSYPTSYEATAMGRWK